jgi:hypothetical protein
MIVHTVAGRAVPPSPGYPPIPHQELRALVETYLGPRRRSGQGYVVERDHTFQEVLVDTRFGLPAVLFAPGVPDLIRTSESVLSGYLSLSTSTPHLFGDRLDQFSADAGRLMAHHSSSGLFWDWPGDTEIILARRKPAA